MYLACVLKYVLEIIITYLKELLGTFMYINTLSQTLKHSFIIYELGDDKLNTWSMDFFKEN